MMTWQCFDIQFNGQIYHECENVIYLMFIVVVAVNMLKLYILLCNTLIIKINILTWYGQVNIFKMTSADINAKIHNFKDYENQKQIIGCDVTRVAFCVFLESF